MAASKLLIHRSPLPDKISTKFQRLYLYFRGPAFHWDSWKYYATKPEVEKFKMAASKLQIHISLLPEKISTKFQRLHICFRGPAFHCNSGEYYATKPEVKKSNTQYPGRELWGWVLSDIAQYDSGIQEALLPHTYVKIELPYDVNIKKFRHLEYQNLGRSCCDTLIITTNLNNN